MEVVGSMSPGSQVLFADALSMSYRERTALRDLSFSLRPGHVMGFLGPNGAGKTTSIRIMTTILRPTSGHFVIDGIGSEHPAKIRPRIGVLPETLGLPKQITGIEYLAYFGRLYGRKGAEARTHSLSLLELVGLRDRASSLIRTYSHGMRRRLGIARALVNDPVVIFLDEPTLGLDPRGQQELLTLLRGIAEERGAGVILCSHSLSEVEDVCDDVVILNAGRVVATGTVAEVLARAREEGSHRDALRLRVSASSAAETRQLLEPLPSVAGVSAGIVEGQLSVELAAPVDTSTSDAHRATNGILEVLVRADIPVLSFEIEGGRLQDAFLQLTAGGQL